MLEPLAAGDDELTQGNQMANTLLSLPIDIPWRRIGISQDMYAPAINQLPLAGNGNLR
jgi:hypothetical protein